MKTENEAYKEACKFLTSGQYKFHAEDRKEKEAFRKQSERIMTGGKIGLAAVARCMKKQGYEIIFKKVV